MFECGIRDSRFCWQSGVVYVNGAPCVSFWVYFECFVLLSLSGGFVQLFLMLIQGVLGLTNLFSLARQSPFVVRSPGSRSFYIDEASGL